ncbi:MarR family winged helix-turn-helix transcriptional regulator [Priestia megaterium]|uniref:MarR family winged helix-turn-helix transcriptional regulator n=1 Tax=Priestia megaterium TaxID=1404 RepID=UPI003672ED33
MKKKTVDLFEFIHTMGIFDGLTMQKWNRKFKYNLGITPIIVLSHLSQYERLRGVELADKLELTPGAITNITNKLYEKKLISRTTDPNNRRSNYYSLEEEGLKVLKEAIRVGREMQLDIVEILTIEEQEQMLNIYKKINKALSTER